MDVPKKTIPDLTEFFLEWHDTCAIDLCKRTEDVCYVHRLFDGLLRQAVSQPRWSKLGKLPKRRKEDNPVRESDGDNIVPLQKSRDESRGAGWGLSVSEYLDLVKSWNRVDKGTHAFHLIELHLYGKDKIKGVPFKNHLFESIAASQNPGVLTGYFRDVLKTITDNSFKNSFFDVERIAGDNDGKDAWDNSETGNTGRLSPLFLSDESSSIDMEKCRETFTSMVRKFWENATIDIRLALLCDLFKVSKHNPTIIARSGLGQSAFYNRHPLDDFSHLFLDSLSKDFDPETIEIVVREMGIDLFRELGENDPACVSVFAAMRTRVDAD